MTKIFLSLGTNLGNRRHNLQQALNKLQAVVTIDTISPIYETAPWGPVQDQPNFYNICLSGSTTLAPLPLLDYFKTLEKAIGRSPGDRWGPRLIDIDLIFYGDEIITAERLTVPHPQLANRAFVLAPLADIAPNLVHPQSGRTIRELLDVIGRDDVFLAAEPPLTVEASS